MENWVKDIPRNAIKYAKGNIQLTIHVLLENQEDFYIAHCLECDLTADGATPKEAQENIIDSIRDHVDFCIEKGNFDKIIGHAPQEYWDKLLHSHQLKRFEFPAPPNKSPNFDYPIKEVDIYEVIRHA